MNRMRVSLNTGKTVIEKHLPKREMRLHEYQAAQLMYKYRIPIPLGTVAFNAKEAYFVAKKFGPDYEKAQRKFVVKAQVQASGRNTGRFKENGFYGGCHIVSTAEEVQDVASKMCGKTLVCPETGITGFRCKCVYIMEELSIEKEMYVSIQYDRKSQMPAFIYCDRGGKPLQELEEQSPDRVKKLFIDINEGVDIKMLSKVAAELGIDNKGSEVIFLLKHLYDCFIQRDAELIEINPLVLTKDGSIVAADTKVIIDDNSLYRQAELKAEQDLSQTYFKERIAHNHNLQYIHAGGNIGILANGAGLAMATMDIIQLYGGKPSNFLDIGGGGTHEQIIESIRLLENDPEVKTILMNIFGGIMHCDKLAASIIRASDEAQTSKPIVLRLKGTNSEEAKKMFEGRSQDFKIHFSEDLDEAAQLAVKIAKEAQSIQMDARA